MLVYNRTATVPSLRAADSSPLFVCQLPFFLAFPPDARDGNIVITDREEEQTHVVLRISGFFPNKGVSRTNFMSIHVRAHMLNIIGAIAAVGIFWVLFLIQIFIFFVFEL